MPAPRIVTTLGTVLEVAGVVVLFRWAPRTSVPIIKSDGTRVQLMTGRPFDTPRSRWGLGLLLAGAVLQTIGTWVPS